MYNEILVIVCKDQFEMEFICELFDIEFMCDLLEGKQVLMKNLIGFYLIMEGIFFYIGFVMVFFFYC